MQSKKHSFIEANINTAIGFIISYFTLLGVNIIYDMKLNPIESMEITLIFTIISVSRNYIVRRIFNNFDTKSNTKIKK